MCRGFLLQKNKVYENGQYAARFIFATYSLFYRRVRRDLINHDSLATVFVEHLLALFVLEEFIW